MDFGFILKKSISVMIMPLSIAMLILLLGLLFLYKDSIKKSKLIITTGFLTLALFSYNPFANTLIGSLEKQYTKLESIPNDVKYILLLGGDFENRAWEALLLYNKNTDLKIITSGYEGDKDIPEAVRNANKLVEIGISKESIIIHPKPKDTKEEAIKIKEVLGNEKFILITSAYHMPRAMALFKKAGTNPIAAPSDFKVETKNKLISFPSSYDLYLTTIALHEYIGLLWYKLKGDI